MKQIAKRLILSVGLTAAMLTTATPANAYYIEYYYYYLINGHGPLSGYAYFCDDGTYLFGDGLHTTVFDTVYYTGQSYPGC